MRGLFVTGTDTGVGKTVLSAALLAAMASAGEAVRAHKPVVTGLDEPPERWPRDHELLAAITGMSPAQVSPLRYGPPTSPHLAAALAGERIEPGEVIARARAAGDGGRTVIVEGVGGLLVPFCEELTVRDLARALDLPVLIAARPGLGTINHTLLAIDAARAAGVRVCAVVLTPWSHEQPSAIELSNLDTIARLGDVEVALLERVPSPAAEDLARAGATLPWRRWREHAGGGLRPIAAAA